MRPPPVDCASRAGREREDGKESERAGSTCRRAFSPIGALLSAHRRGAPNMSAAPPPPALLKDLVNPLALKHNAGVASYT